MRINWPTLYSIKLIIKVTLTWSVAGVTVSMVAFQAVDPGSTPGRRTFFFPYFSYKFALYFCEPHIKNDKPYMSPMDRFSDQRKWCNH